MNAIIWFLEASPSFVSEFLGVLARLWLWLWGLALWALSIDYGAPRRRGWTWVYEDRNKRWRSS